MLHVYEFEIFPDGDGYLALPFDMGGGTEGYTFADAVMMAADWLRAMCEHMDMDGDAFPKPTFGNQPRHEGGKVICMAVVAGKETVDKVSASEAARMLGVTPGRVTQMLKSCRLAGWREGRRTWITVDSINARLAEKPHAGRPRKTAATA